MKTAPILCNLKPVLARTAKSLLDSTTLILPVPGVSVERFLFVRAYRSPGTMASGIQKYSEPLLDFIALTLRALVLANAMLWFGKCYLYVRAFRATPAS